MLEISREKWTKIQGLPLSTLEPALLGKTVDMKANCDIAKNFHQESVVIHKMWMANNGQEVMMQFKTKSGSEYRVGCNMNGLSVKLSSSIAAHATLS